MATEVWPELTNIQDEDVLRKMWQETEDFGRKKEIRARMYKLREQRLKDFYTVGEAQSEMSVRKMKTHTESIGDQGSFLTMKSKEIRDSESPTRDLSCSRRDEKWSGKYGDDKRAVAKIGRDSGQQSVAPQEPGQVMTSTTVSAGNATSSQRMSQSSSSVRTSQVSSSQSVVQSSKSEVRTSGSTQVSSGARQITTGDKNTLSTTEYQEISGVSGTNASGANQQTVTTTRTVKQATSGSPEEVVRTTVTAYTSSDRSQPVREETAVKLVSNDASAREGLNEADQNISTAAEFQSAVRNSARSVSQSDHVRRSQERASSTVSVQQSSTQRTSVQKSSVSVENRAQSVSHSKEITENRSSVAKQDSKQSLISDTRSHSVRDDNVSGDKVLTIQDSKDKNQSNQVQITEVSAAQTTSTTDSRISKENMTDRSVKDVKSIDVVDCQSRGGYSTNEITHRQDTSVTSNKEALKRSSTSSTDQKIMNEIKKLDSYLSTQPTPSNSVPISPIDANWPVDKEFVYTETAPRDKPMVNGGRGTPVRHPTNLELPRGATDGQYVTTYQHDYSPRVSRDHDTNHQYFASTLRASPSLDRSSPSPSKRSSSKGSLDRSTPDRKYRSSPSRKTPDHERRLSSSSYTIERISDSKRRTTDNSQRSQTLPKDKPKRKLSSTQTKTTNKTRLSTPGSSPTSSPTRVQRVRKVSSSESDSDQSNATFSKLSSSLKHIDNEDKRKYSSSTRVRGSSTSVNITDNDSRPFSSPSPNRHPARENTPDYSSEGSITRELKTSRLTDLNDKLLTSLDSSPERSAFAPIKSFRTSPEKRDQTLNMINEEQRMNVQSTTTVLSTSDDSKYNQQNIGRTETFQNKSTDSRATVNKNVQGIPIKPKQGTPSSSPERKIKHTQKSSIVDSSEKKAATSSPTRRSPTKNVDRKSPTKPSNLGYSSQKSNDRAKPQAGILTAVKRANVKKTTSTPGTDRITRRSSIPRAEINKASPRQTRVPEPKQRPSFTRDTTSSATRVSTTRIQSPSVLQTRTTVKSNDRLTVSSVKDTKLSTIKKPETSTPKKTFPTAAGQRSPTKAVTDTKNNINNYKKTVVNKKEVLKKKETVIRSRQDESIKIANASRQKNINQQNIAETNIRKETFIDKDSSDSIEDEQPPEFFDDIADRDEVDNTRVDHKTADSSTFKLYETDTSVVRPCDKTQKIESTRKETLKSNKESTNFIAAEKKSVSKSSDAPRMKTPSKLSVKNPSGAENMDSSSISSSDEDEGTIIELDSDIKTSNNLNTKKTKRHASKENAVKEKTSNTLRVDVQIPKSSRESSPGKLIPMSVTSDGGQTPRYADFITEPEDVEVFDSKNLGPNRPIPNTVLDDNRIVEEGDERDESVSVADRVSKYIEKTNKVDIVTLDTTKQQSLDSSSDVLRTKELFETITKSNVENESPERRGSKKFDNVNDFIQREAHEVVSSKDISTSFKSNESNMHQSSVVKTDVSKHDALKTSPKKQQPAEELLKKPERRLSEHSPDIESKKAFFEKKSKEHMPSEPPNADTEPCDISERAESPADDKLPHYMLDTVTAATRKESIQREFAPARQGTDTEIQYTVKEKRNSVDIDKVDSFKKSESFHTSKEAKAPTSHPAKDLVGKRRSSKEINELDTFKKTEAFILCEDKTRVAAEKRSSVDMQRNQINLRKDSCDLKRRPSQGKSPEQSPSRKPSKDKSADRVPLKKKDTNIMADDRAALRRTSSGASPGRKPGKEAHPQTLTDPLPEIEDIFDLQTLEILLTRAVQYEERSRIRAQIRIVKKSSETRQNRQPARKISSAQAKTEKESYQKKSVNTVEKPTSKDGKRTPSPVKDSKPHQEAKKTTIRASPERRSSSFRRDSKNVYEERRVTGDGNTTTIRSVSSYTSPDNRYSVRESKTETRTRVVSGSPERKTVAGLETATRKTTPYPVMTERKAAAIFESVTSREPFRSSPERKDSTRGPTGGSPERKHPYETRKTSSDTTRKSPERRSSKEQTTSEVRRSSKTSPERRTWSEVETRTVETRTEQRRSSKDSDVRRLSRTSPDRRVSADLSDHSRRCSHVLKTTTSHVTTSSTVGRKVEDSITSSYGVGPTDGQGRPLFGLRALRSTHRAADEARDVELGEDAGDSCQDVTGPDGRPLFGLRALQTSSGAVTTTVLTQDMPSTQHLVQKHQQFLSEVKSAEDKVRGSAPKARLRDSFILDPEVAPHHGPSVPPLGSAASLRTIIQKHEDMASTGTGKNVRREVQSTKTVTSCHGTVSSDGKVSLTKHVIHGEARGADGAEPTGRVTTSQYSYRSPDDPRQRPSVSSTAATTHIGSAHRSSITSVGEVKVEEVNDCESRRDSLVSSAKRSLESKHRDEGRPSETWPADNKSLVRGDSVKALQHKFQQPTGKTSEKAAYPKAGLILRSNGIPHSDDHNHISSAMKRISGEEVQRPSVEERRTSSVREEETRGVSRTASTGSRRESSSTGVSRQGRESTTSVTSAGVMRQGKETTASVTSFLDDTSKVTGVQDILQRMRNADLVTERSDTTEDTEARSLLNKFLGASVILQGMEAGGGGPTSSALVSQVERQRIMTSTQRKADEVDDIVDEKHLQILLEACSDYEQRRKIRARLRKIMADRKGGQGELVGVEDGEERQEEHSESREFSSSDGNTFTRTEVHKTSTSSARLTKANSVQQSPFAKFRQLERQNSAPRTSK